MNDHDNTEAPTDKLPRQRCGLSMHDAADALRTAASAAAAHVRILIEQDQRADRIAALLTASAVALDTANRILRCHPLSVSEYGFEPDVDYDTSTPEKRTELAAILNEREARRGAKGGQPK